MQRREFIRKLGLASISFSLPGVKGDWDKATPKTDIPGNDGYDIISESVHIDGIDRTYWYGMSSDPLDRNFELLVLCLHPSGGNGLNFWGGPVNTRNMARKYKALFVFPDGTGDVAANSQLPVLERVYFWNAGYCCLSAMPTVENGVITAPGPNDSSFLSYVIGEMLRKFNMPPRRVCLLGHSNGGMMAQKFAVEAPLYGIPVDAFASIAGPGAGYVGDNPGVLISHDPNESLTPGLEKISAFIGHGINDACTPYHGGKSVCGNFNSFRETADAWILYNNAELVDVQQESSYTQERYMERLPEGIDATLGRRTEVIALSVDYNHLWPDFIDVNGRILDFFTRVTLDKYPRASGD